MQQLTSLLGNEIVSKVDRIIFVASAISRELPEELIKAVKLQASGGTRGSYNIFKCFYLGFFRQSEQMCGN